MAQRQTLPESVGETANHYHICISYASLVGNVLLSCRLADNAVTPSPSPSLGGDQEGDGSSSEAGGGGGGRGGGAVEQSAVTGGSVEGRGPWLQAAEGEERQRGLRLHWAAESDFTPIVTF